MSPLARILVGSSLLAFAACGCAPAGPGAEPVGGPSVRPGAPAVSLRWVQQRDLDLEGEVQNLTDGPLENVHVAAVVEKLEKDAAGQPLTWETSAAVTHSRPGEEWRVRIGGGPEQTMTSPGGPDRTIPAGERGGFLLLSVDRRLVRRVEVYRLPPGQPERREVLGVFQAAEIR